jgi:hypothetical protein
MRCSHLIHLYGSEWFQRALTATVSSTACLILGAQSKKARVALGRQPSEAALMMV